MPSITSNLRGRSRFTGTRNFAKVFQAYVQARSRTNATTIRLRLGSVTTHGQNKIRGAAYHYNRSIVTTKPRFVAAMVHAVALVQGNTNTRQRQTSGIIHAGKITSRFRGQSRVQSVCARKINSKTTVAPRFIAAIRAATHSFSSRFLARSRFNGLLNAHHTFTSTIIGFSVTGDLISNYEGAYSYDTDNRTSTGRKGLGLLVYALDVTTLAEVADVPIDRHFFVSQAYAGGPSDPIRLAGGDPGDIGKKITISGVVTYIYRAPYPGEVAIYVPGKELYRFEEDRETQAYVWKRYRSMPQRFLDGNTAISLLDPDKLLNFFAVMAGSMMSTLSTETAILGEQYDADKTLTPYIPLVAGLYGVNIPAADPELDQRGALRTAVPVLKLTGTAEAIRIRLLALGYNARVHDLWVHPGAPSAKLTATVNGSASNIGLAYKIGTVTPTETQVYPLALYGMTKGSAVNPAVGALMFTENIQPLDGDTLTIKTPTLTKTFEFDDNATVTGGRIAVAIGVNAQATMNTLIGAINAAGLTITAVSTTPVPPNYKAALPLVPGLTYSAEALGEGSTPPPPGTWWSTSDLGAGTDYISVAKGQSRTLPTLPYFASSRIAIYLSGSDGTPARLGSEEEAQRLFAAISKILPVNTDVRLFGVERAVTPAEGIAIGETFTVAHI